MPSMHPSKGLSIAACAIACTAAFTAVTPDALATVVPAGDSAPCSRPSPTGLRTIELSDQGQSRPFALYVPDSYDGHRRVPVVFNLHGSGGSGAGQMNDSRLLPPANAAGFAVLAPTGAVKTGDNAYAWNVPGVPLVSGQPVPDGTPNDERYLLAVLKETKRVLCVNPRRVYATGMSGGARMTSQLGCDFADRLTAIAPVAGLRAGVPEQGPDGGWTPTKSTCRPKRPLSVLTFHSTDDPTNPYPGSDDQRWGYSILTALARWATVDKCTGVPTTTAVTAITELVSYTKCKGGATVSLYRSSGGGHTWPHGDDGRLDASALIIKFFSRKTL